MTARLLKGVALLLALVFIAGLAAPKFNAEGYRSTIHAALEQALQRKVQLNGKLRFNLFTGPGFSVDDVRIAEDPELGAEPIAYAVTLTAIPRLWSLWTGHLEFSTLRLDDAQINLTRVEPEPGQYRWNVERLMRPSIVAAFPAISIRNSRINFKAENLKSVVYLLDCDLDISPPSSAKDGWHIQFEGKPARTDRAARGSGILTARGAWYRSNGNLDLNIQLDRSELSDVVSLVRGEDLGWQGLISGKAHLAGPPDAIAINGRLTLAELHGWEQTVPEGEVWPLNVAGVWNVRGQQLKLDAGVSGKVTAHYLVEKYFTQPRWGVSLSFQKFSVEPLVNVARHLGAPLPPDLKLKGELDAAIGFSSGSSAQLQGGAVLHDAELSLGGAPPVQIPSAQLIVAQGRAKLAPTEVTFPGGRQATFEAGYEIGDATPAFTVSTRGLDARTLPGVPLLSGLAEGQWSGQLRYEDQEWSGAFDLSKAVLNFPGFASPVKVLSAEGRLDGARVVLQRIRASAGALEAQGEYRYEPGATRPHRFRLAVARLDTAALEKLAMPALAHSGGLFSFGKPLPPEWLRQLRADGSVQIGLLRAGAVELSKFRSRVIWDGTHIALPDVSAAIGDGSLTSRVLVDLSGRVPVYELFSKLANVPWKDGSIDADTVLETSGLGSDTLAHLRSSGSFAGRDVLDDFSSVSGRYDFKWSAGAPRLNFSDLKLAGNGEVLTGNAALQRDGMLLMQLANGTRQVRVNPQ
jgi:hypothetical protein